MALCLIHDLTAAVFLFFLLVSLIVCVVVSWSSSIRRLITEPWTIGKKYTENEMPFELCTADLLHANSDKFLTVAFDFSRSYAKARTQFSHFLYLNFGKLFSQCQQRGMDHLCRLMLVQKTKTFYVDTFGFYVHLCTVAQSIMSVQFSCEHSFKLPMKKAFVVERMDVIHKIKWSSQTQIHYSSGWKFNEGMAWNPVSPHHSF